MLIAGEASGDVLAAELVGSLRRLTALEAPFPWTFFGAGGPRMRTAGVELAIDLTEHAVVGLWEVFKHYPELRRVFRRLLRLACNRQPELIILVDYPGFNLRFAAAIQSYVRRRRGAFLNWRPRLVYYVSPQLWAWHASRVRQVNRDIDLMISIFPFEKAWYAARAPRLAVEFVGHPIVDRYAGGPLPSPALLDGSKQEAPPPQGAAPAPPSASAPLVALLPGSRKRELKKHASILALAAQHMTAKHPVRCVMVLPSAALADFVRHLVGAAPEMSIQAGGLADVLARASVAIAASGTVTLECARFVVPTVVIYRTSWSTYWLARRLVRLQHIAMPNLLARAPVFPELIQSAATPSRIAEEALDLLTNSPRRQAVQTALTEVIRSLGAPGASMRAAQAVLRLLKPHGYEST